MVLELLRSQAADLASKGKKMTKVAKKTPTKTAKPVAKAAKATTSSKPQISGALSALQGLIKDSSEKGSSGSSVPSITDPAIAKAKLVKTVVQLGEDKDFMETAAGAVEVHREMARLKAQYQPFEEKLRDYGMEKRGKYNSAYNASVVTVAIPANPPPEGDVSKVDWIQIVCSNKYSTKDEMILSNRDRLGEWFTKLFSVKEEEVLRPDAKGILLDVFKNVGLSEEDAATAMSRLFVKNEKVSTRLEYEKLSQGAPEEVKAILEQSVSRSAPGVKFKLSED